MAKKQPAKQHHKLIQNYGLFWDREKVDWHRYRATLCGVADTKEGPVDFRGQVGIYALYDHEFRLLYVGQAGRGNNTLFVRLKHHATRPGNRGLAARWKYFSWFGVIRVLKKEKELTKAPATRLTRPAEIFDALEAVVIEIADPVLNRQGGRLGGATEYLQYESVDVEEAVAEAPEASSSA